MTCTSELVDENGELSFIVAFKAARPSSNSGRISVDDDGDVDVVC